MVNCLDIRSVVKFVMEMFWDEVEEVVNLIVWDGNEVMYIEKVDMFYLVCFYILIGRCLFFYVGVCLCIILVYLFEKE